MDPRVIKTKVLLNRSSDLLDTIQASHEKMILLVLTVTRILKQTYLSDTYAELFNENEIGYSIWSSFSKEIKKLESINFMCLRPSRLPLL